MNNDEPVLLEDSSDFEWHRKRLDLVARMTFEHVGKPEEYPCKVISEFQYNGNGPDYYFHKFIYRQTCKCGSCGHISQYWPEIPN